MERVVWANFPDPSQWSKVRVRIILLSTLEDKLHFSGVEGIMVTKFIFWVMMEAETPILEQARKCAGFKPVGMPWMTILWPDPGVLPPVPPAAAQWGEANL